MIMRMPVSVIMRMPVSMIMRMPMAVIVSMAMAMIMTMVMINRFLLVGLIGLLAPFVCWRLFYVLMVVRMAMSTD